MNQRELFLRHVAQTSDLPLSGVDVNIVRANGVKLFDHSGREYIDLISGISVSNVGHCHPDVLEAITNQSQKFMHLMVYGEFNQSPQVTYATALTKLLPAGLDSVYYTTSGSEAVEGALKLAKRATSRTEIISFKNAYHGSTHGALSVMGDEYFKNSFRPLLPGIKILEYNNVHELRQISSSTAAVIIELVQGEAGIRKAEQEFITLLHERCKQNGVLLIVDDACMYMFSADQKYRAQLILTNSLMRAALVTSTVCNLPNITLDAGISFVSAPSYSQTLCRNFINPSFNLTNYGTTSLTSATLSFNVDGVNTQTMSWTGNLAPNSSSIVILPQITPITLGPHVFNVSVSSPNGGIDNNNINNTNNQIFSVNNILTFSAPSGQTCLGNSLVVTATGATSYSWSTGATTASVSLSPSVTTIYSVTATTGSCSSVQLVTVSIGPGSAPILSVNTQSVCFNEPSIITASGASSYSWNTGASSSTISVSLTSSTDYTVTGFSNPTCSTSLMFNVSVNPLPASTLITTNVSCANCSDGMISVSAVDGMAPYSYTWMPGNINAATINSVSLGCYTVTISDALGCVAENFACISFDVGVPEWQNKSSLFKVSPNPTKGEFVIESEYDAVRIEIIDVFGKLIKQQQMHSGIGELNISSQASGVYYVRAISGSRVTVVKLVKE